MLKTLFFALSSLFTTIFSLKPALPKAFISIFTPDFFADLEFYLTQIMDDYNYIEDLLERYEEMIRVGIPVYFDSNEFEDIADYYGREDPDVALNVVEEGLKQHPGNQNLLLKKVGALIYNEHYSEAAALMEGLSIDETDWDVLLYKAEIHLNTGLVESGLGILDMALEQTDDEYTLWEAAYILRSVNLFEDATYYLKKGLERFPESLDIRREIAENYRLSGKFEEAIEIYNEILDVDPYSAEDWTDLGELYSLNADYEKAIEAFDFSITIDETDEQTVFMKANCLILNGSFEKAIETYHDYIALNPDDETPYIMIAECYEEMEQDKKAFEYCLKAIEVNPESVLAFKKMIYFLMERESFEEALAYVNKALTLTHTDSNLYFLKADIFTAMERLSEATDYYKKALVISENPDEKTDILYSIGILKQKEGKNNDALPFFEEVEKTKSDFYSDLFIKMAVSYYKTGQYDKCVKYIEKALNESIDDLSEEEIRDRDTVIDELIQLLQDTGY